MLHATFYSTLPYPTILYSLYPTLSALLYPTLSAYLRHSKGLQQPPYGELSARTEVEELLLHYPGSDFRGGVGGVGLGHILPKGGKTGNNCHN